MNRIKIFAEIAAFAFVVLILPTTASAQWRDRGRDDDYYGNSRYNRNIRGTIQNLRNRARNFERRLDRIEDRDDRRRGGRYNDRYNGRYGSRVDDLEVLADRFARATDDLADEYGRGRNLNNSRDEAQRVLSLASQIDQYMYRSRINRNAQREWDQMRYDLQVVADVYGLGRYDRGGYNRGRTGDWRNRIPFPF